MNPDLAPLTLVDILDRSISLYRRHFKLFSGICAVTYAPFYLILLILQTVMVLFLGAEGAPFAETGAVIVIVLVSLMFIPIIFITQAAVVKALSDIYLGDQGEASERKGASVVPQIRTTYRFVGGLWLPLLGTLLLQCLIICGWVVLSVLLIPVVGLVIFFFRYLLVNQTIVLEGLSGMDALNRSWKLVGGDKDSVLKVVVTFIVMTVLPSFLQMAFSMPIIIAGTVALAFFQINPQWVNIAANAVQYTLAVFTVPLPLIALTLAYYDIRIRKEGFDLKMLAEHIRGSEA
ncbi:MAG: hypothetical protein HYU64_07525 [Armatimonadetes bacterium]|nr:hypothetical protein [Armatimonadota bacterium]